MENNQQIHESSSKGGGIKKAARWVARMFGYKAENKFARGMWYVFATSVTVIVLIIAALLIYESGDWLVDKITVAKNRREQRQPTYLHEYHNRYVSPSVVYHDWYPTYLYNMKTGLRTLTDIHWICKSSDGDSIACYSTLEEHKRGYFNLLTGEAVIPAQFDKAWIFSEGLACVYEKGMLHFIDHQGHDVMGKEFPYGIRNDDYCFHNGLCIMFDGNGRFGLIDKQGNWAVSPEYYEIAYDTKGFWLVQDRDWNYGMLDAEGKMLLPVEYENIDIHHQDSCIFVSHFSGLNQVLDFGCNVVNPCNYTKVDKLIYQTDDIDEEGAFKLATATCLVYNTGDWQYGLMDRNGNIITLPLYSFIEAIGPDRYHCEGPNGSVILDSKGREVGEKL